MFAMEAESVMMEDEDTDVMKLPPCMELAALFDCEEMLETEMAGDIVKAFNFADAGKFLRATQEAMVTGTISQDIGRMIQVAFWTGCKRSEVTALRWDHYINSTLSIDEFSPDERPMYVVARHLPVVWPLNALLEEQRDWLQHQIPARRKCGLMFPASAQHIAAADSRKWERPPAVMDKPIAKICHQAGLKRATSGTLRTTHGRLLGAVGAPEDIVDAVLGNKSALSSSLKVSYDDVKDWEMRLAERVTGTSTAAGLHRVPTEAYHGDGQS